MDICHILEIVSYLTLYEYVEYSDVADIVSSRSQWQRIMSKLRNEGLVKCEGKKWYPTDKLLEVV